MTTKLKNDLKVAERAKQQLAHRFSRDPRVNGVGIGGSESHYVIRVNLVDADNRPSLPREVNGVPVEGVVVGEFEI